MTTYMQSTEENLTLLAHDFLEKNPDLKVFIDGSGVWFQHGDTDYGVYQKTIDGRVLVAYQGNTFYVHRKHKAV